jgi:hypothetical protein
VYLADWRWLGAQRLCLCVCVYVRVCQCVCVCGCVGVRVGVWVWLDSCVDYNQTNETIHGTCHLHRSKQSNCFWFFVNCVSEYVLQVYLGDHCWLGARLSVCSSLHIIRF